MLFPPDSGGCLRNSQDRAPGRCFLLVIPGLDKLIADRKTESWTAEVTGSGSQGQFSRVETEPRAPQVQPGVFPTPPHPTGASGHAQSRSWRKTPAQTSAHIERSVERGCWYQPGPTNCSGLQPDSNLRHPGSSQSAKEVMW